MMKAIGSLSSIGHHVLDGAEHAWWVGQVGMFERVGEWRVVPGHARDTRRGERYKMTALRTLLPHGAVEPLGLEKNPRVLGIEGGEQQAFGVPGSRGDHDLEAGGVTEVGPRALRVIEAALDSTAV